MKLIIALALFVSMCANAYNLDELHKLMDDKEVDYVGVCRVDKENKLVFTDKQAVDTPQCVVCHEGNIAHVRLVVLFRNNRPDRVIRFDIKTGEQTVIWLFRST